MDGIIINVFYIVALLFSITIHEVSHGVVANNLGDPTAKNLGRLTLNPLKHLDMFGSIILPLLTLTLGGFLFGYAKPVPYNPYNLNDKKWGPAKIALAGPASNIILAVLLGLTLRFLPDVFSSALVPQFLATAVMMNLFLAVFNLFPVPPLDGHWILMTVLPASFNWLKNILYQQSFLILLIVLFFIFPLVVPWIGKAFELITGIGF